MLVFVFGILREALLIQIIVCLISFPVQLMESSDSECSADGDAEDYSDTDSLE